MKFVLIIFFIFTLVGVSCGQTKATVITFCHFKVAENIKQGNASFNLRYGFQLDSKGKPKNIKDLSKLSDAFGDKESVIKCLNTWSFPNLKENSKLITLFRWEHGQGWVRLMVFGNKFKQVIKINGYESPN